MSSFYGGKQGRTYNIVKNYPSVQQMVLAFNGGGGYTDVNYGQYVIIDTIDKNNPQNGLLFRRGFDYSRAYKPAPNINNSIYDREEIVNNEVINTYKDYEAWREHFHMWAQDPGGGAIYVGQIVGPAGAVPSIKLENWETFVSHSTVHQNNAGTHQGFQIQTPGYVAGTPSTYNDYIDFGIANVKDQNQNVSEVHLGIDIPYTVFQSTVNTNPYEQPGVIESDDSKTHPFYYKWNFNIPGGKKGTDLVDFYIKTGSQVQRYIKTQDSSPQEEKLYYTIAFNEQNNQWEYTPILDTSLIQDIDACYEVSSLGDQNQNQYLVYKTKDYTEHPEGLVSEDLGIFPWRVINEISPIPSERTLVSEEILTDTVSLPSQVHLGDLAIIPLPDQNQEQQSLVIYGKKYLICIKAGDNSITSVDSSYYNYSEGTILPQNTNQQEALWRVITISQQAPPHGLDIDYTNGLNSEILYSFYDYFYVDSTGNFYVKRIDGDGSQHYDYLSTIDSLKSMIYNELEGKITINYISGKNINIPFTTVKDFQLQIDRTKSQQLKVNYIRDSQVISSTINGKINTVLDAKMQGDFLVVLFSDPDYRNAIISTMTQNQDYFFLNWTQPGENGIIYDGNISERGHEERLPWIKLSSVNGQYHIFTTLDSFAPLDKNGNNEIAIYKNGLDASHAGWLVQVIYDKYNEDLQDTQITKGLFAYDYQAARLNKSYIAPDGNTQTYWFEVMSIAESIAANPLDHILFSKPSIEDSSNPPSSVSMDLKNNGVWFVVSNGHHD